MDEFIDVELTQKQIEQLQKQPIIETVIRLSEDQKWFIHKTVITDLKPVNYINKVLEA